MDKQMDNTKYGLDAHMSEESSLKLQLSILENQENHIFLSATD